MRDPEDDPTIDDDPNVLDPDDVPVGGSLPMETMTDDDDEPDLAADDPDDHDTGA